MRILLSNDDGFGAPGLEALRVGLQDLGDVWVSAPTEEWSAKSHAFTLRDPVSLHPRGVRQLAVGGSPADATYVGMHHLLKSLPELVVSGINPGGNLGQDVFYSGTVAAAREARIHGVPSIAVSLVTEFGDPKCQWATALAVLRQVLERGWVQNAPANVFYNLNVPNVALPQLQGVRVRPLGRRIYPPHVDVHESPRGARYAWIGGPPQPCDSDDGTDIGAVDTGYASLTPLTLDCTDHGTKETLHGW